MASETKSISGAPPAGGTFTDSFSPIGKEGTTKTGYVNVSVSNTFTGTITLQRSFDSGSNWVDVKEYTTPAEEFFQDLEPRNQYRIGIKNGDFGSGQADVRLSG